MAFQEKIGTLTKTSSTQVQLAGSSIVKLGGQQRVLTSPTLLISTSGIGGIDTGAVAASTFYYVYAVYNGSITGLVASLSSVSPTGFTRYKKVGAFYVDDTGSIFLTVNNGETPSLGVLNYTPVFTGFGTTPTSVIGGYSIVDGFLNVFGRFIPDTATATEARIGLPVGLTVTNSPLATSGLSRNGRWYRASSGVSIRKSGPIFTNISNVSYLTLSSDDYTTAASPSVVLDGNIISPTNLAMFFECSGMTIVGLPNKPDWKDY